MTHDLGERFPDVAALAAALGTTGYLAEGQLAAAIISIPRLAGRTVPTGARLAERRSRSAAELV